jgi:hypothetical protein
MKGEGTMYYPSPFIFHPFLCRALALYSSLFPHGVVIAFFTFLLRNK